MKSNYYKRFALIYPSLRNKKDRIQHITFGAVRLRVSKNETWQTGMDFMQLKLEILYNHKKHQPWFEHVLFAHRFSVSWHCLPM